MKKVKKGMILLALCLMAGCTSEKSRETEKKEAARSEQDNERKPEAGNDLSNEKESELEITDEGSQVLSVLRTAGYGNKNGYYYIKPPRDKDYGHIKYVDYRTKREVYLCNKPNCKHNNDSCSAYASMTVSQVFPFGDSLYCIDEGGALASFGGGESVIKPDTIYKMDLDGANKVKLYESRSGETLGNAFVLTKDFMYCMSSKEQLVEVSGAYQTQVNELNVIEIRLSTGEMRKLKNVQTDSRIVGGYNGKLILERNQFPKEMTNEQMLDQDYYLSQLRQSKSLIFALDLQTGEETELAAVPYEKCSLVEMDKNRVYMIDKNISTIRYVEIDTKKQGVLYKNLPKGIEISGINGNKLVLLKSNLKDSYLLDLQNGQLKKCTLRTKAGNSSLRILAETDKEFLVMYDLQEQTKFNEYINDYETLIVGEIYGMISKTDYFDNRKNVIPIKGQ